MTNPNRITLMVHGEHELLARVHLRWPPGEPVHRAECALCGAVVHEGECPGFALTAMGLTFHLEESHGARIRGIHLDAPGGPGPSLRLTEAALMAIQGAFGLSFVGVHLVAWYGPTSEEWEL